MYFQNLDIQTILMKGRSTPEQRTLAWSISVIVIAALLLGFLVSPISLTDMITPSGSSPINYFSVTLQMVGGVFLITTLQEMLFPHKKPYVSKLRKYSPIGYLESKDQKVISKAYNQIIDLSQRVNFAYALELAEYEPEIKQDYGNLRVIAAQRQGKLAAWINNESRLLQACRLVYLCHRAEQKKEDIRTNGVSDIF
ncbi:MAG: hypothetical protein JXR47_05920 [Thiotrichales bacterium]|nr:hypothetical protein [Thiotrichales bacterium]